MRLDSGARLGPYAILGPIGAGGMGEVYRARDVRLDRIVAVKVLSADAEPSVESRQRFEREARTISQLSHPNICPLFDVGEEGDIRFLVMPPLDGETMAAVASRGPLPTDLVLRYAIEIADALDAAHRAGVVHRGLKPANVMVTASGVKLLDFGLAKPAAGDVGGVTVGVVTSPGMIAGTVPYMSPEQLEGRPADHRGAATAASCSFSAPTDASCPCRSARRRGWRSVRRRCCSRCRVAGSGRTTTSLPTAADFSPS